MSLISDALRKARREAAERDAARRGTFPDAAIVDREPQSPLLSTAAIAACVVAAVVIGGAIAWKGLSPTHSPPRVVVVPVPTPRDLGAVPTPVAVPRPPHESEPAPPERPPSPPDPSSSSNDIRVQDTAGARAPAVVSPEPAETVPTERVFVGEAVINGVTFRLDYIVHRETNPFAVVNGVEIREGSRIEDFSVERIERDRVILCNPEGPLVVRAK